VAGFHEALAFNEWFDHQADRYGRVIAWALHHRVWMALIAVASLAAALALQAKFGAKQISCRRPMADDRRRGARAIKRSLDYNRLKVEKAAELARNCPRPRPRTAM
jgi:HAE1 family hydrophobic/amphiphilic exporter-1